jgi:hypothetical protein
MLDPDRVLQMEHLPGERVRVELDFQWDGQLSAVTGHFRRFVGSRFSARHLEPGISLVGNEPRREVEGDETYMSVELEGVIPGSIAPGDYYCKFVHFDIPDRGWILMFENLPLSVRVVGRLPTHSEREGARLFGVRFLG